MNIHTADLCDENQDKKLQILSPKFKNYGGLKRFYGQIETVKLDKSNFRLLEMLRDEDGEGRIVVVDNAQEFFGVVGDKLMAFAAKNNWQAIILNGYVRDTDETKNINVGLFAIGTCPLRNFDKTESSRGEEISFEGLTFNRGDYIYADNDGIVISKEKLV
ncbi:ribonuclease E activity regulator RraA [Arcobacter roscoffensis]|uniref:4-hydroxy-4-methyl-2-oxoglutarate aldolase n=1 Tax=Arcobacter roscoffensis TaxID=2961520 RepID=A0ABY5E671_9BACT|nr:ribonuclease E activity regulator RraA [Arcobacter roscoffensis]UTJ07654.1 ribonuclease E activity regulator RraA [Arcobacter roscoffensis]|tara:strand:+ start:38 stop:520 length:483 start_codon:yes stop_codon:yes gene_type:complete